MKNEGLNTGNTMMEKRSYGIIKKYEDRFDLEFVENARKWIWNVVVCIRDRCEQLGNKHVNHSYKEFVMNKSDLIVALAEKKIDGKRQRK